MATIISRADALASAEFQAAVAASHKVATLVQVLDPDGAVLDEIPIMGGAVALDSNAAVRASCSLDLVDSTGSLLPDSPTHMLAPYGNELRVCRGVTYLDGSSDVVSLGIFRIESVEVDDQGDSFTIRIAGRDRAARVIDARFETPYQVAAGTNFATAITTLVEDAYPGVTTSFASTSVTTPLLVAEEGDDRWDFCQGLAEAIGAELYFDGDGVLRLAPTSASVAPVASFSEGDGGVLLQAARNWSRESAFNRVIVTGESQDDTAPVRGVATDDNSASPTFYGGPFGQVPDFWASSFITTATQAADAAEGRLAKLLGTTEQISFGAITNPALEPGNTVTITRERIGVSEDHIIDQLSVPLSFEQPMTGQTRITQVR